MTKIKTTSKPNQDLRNYVCMLVDNEREKAEKRRDKLIAAFEELKTALDITLEAIKDLPDGIGLVQDVDRLSIRHIESGDVVAEVEVSLEQLTPKAKASIVYYYFTPAAEGDKLARLTSLQEVIRALAEALFEDINKINSIEPRKNEVSKELNIVIPDPERVGSAPDDTQVQIVVRYMGIDKAGVSVKGSIKALSIQDARVQLVKNGITIVELERIGKVSEGGAQLDVL